MNEDYALFSAVWKFFRAHSTVTAADWGQIMQEARELYQQFPTDFCKRLVLSALDELEQRSKENTLS